jgi:DNA ligase-1
VSIAPAVECRTADELRALFEAALARSNEGLVAKDPASPYTPGRRGKAWLKLKRPLATLDVVVVAVEYGHGKRHRVLSDYTFAVRDGQRLAVIGKAYSGLTDAEIAELTAWFLAHRVAAVPRTVDPARVLSPKSPVPASSGSSASSGTAAVNLFGPIPVEPLIVIEVAFNNLQRSARHDSGFALRFPRIARLRPDKSSADIDTLARVAELYAQQLPPARRKP